MKHPDAPTVIERRARADTLRWVAAELDAQVAEAKQDWVKVMLSSGARSRINTLEETAVMCRAAAARVERGKDLTAPERTKGRGKS